MKAESAKSKVHINRDQIINYEFQVLEQQIPPTKQLASDSNKYSFWQLQDKIKKIVTDHSRAKVRWIGNASTAYLQAYAYILLIGSGYSQSSIIQFKHAIYKLGRDCLQVKEQKLLVQFLCLIQYSRDRYSFLNKYPEMQGIFVKILQSVENEQQNMSSSNPDSRKKATIRRKASPQKDASARETQNLLSQQQLFQTEIQLQKLYCSFHHHFPFIEIIGSNQYCCTIKLFEEKVVYIVIEKDCYFMVELEEQNGPFDEGKTDQIQDFGKVLHSERDGGYSDEEEMVQRTPKEDRIVQESNVVVVERASQIRKPSLKQFYTTPKFASLIRDSPIHPVQEFNIQLKDIPQKSLIQELYTNNTPKKKFELLQTLENEKKVRKDKNNEAMLQKMRAIQEMKEALQKVREKIEKKIKVIDEVQNFKSEIATRMGERQELRKDWSQSNKMNFLQPFPSRHSMKYITQNKKRNRKVSYNEPRPSQKLYVRNRLHQEDNLRFLSKPTSPQNQRVLSENTLSRPRSKVNSIENSPLPYFSPPQPNSPKSKYLSPPNIKIRKGREATQIVKAIGSVQPNNVNVNVNVSINESHFPSSNGQYPNRYKTDPQNKKLPVTLVPPQRVQSSQYLHSAFMKSPKSLKPHPQAQNLTTATSPKTPNPQSSFPGNRPSWKYANVSI